MTLFIVYGIDSHGQKQLDGFEAYSLENLHKLLRHNQFIPLKINTVPKQFEFLKGLFIPTLSSEQVIEMLDNLNVVLKAGIPINQGLQDIQEDATKQDMKKILARITSDVSSGMPLSQACKPFEKSFNPTIINLMAIGEETGKLTTTLKNGADFLRKTEALKKNTKKALFTPLISLVLILLAVAAWMNFVVPGMVDFFKDMDTQLPPLTLFLIDASAFSTQYTGVIILGIVVFFIVFQLLYKYYKSFRKAVLALTLKIPLISKMIKFFNIAFITEYLQLSVNSGLTLYESLLLLKTSIANDLYQEDIENIIDHLEKGIPLSQTTKNNPLYTNFVTRVLEIGETTGSMEKELQTISQAYYEKVEDLSQLIPKVVQPMTLLVGGGFMALIMMGLMGPIYDLIGKM